MTIFTPRQQHYKLIIVRRDFNARVGTDHQTWGKESLAKTVSGGVAAMVSYSRICALNMSYLSYLFIYLFIYLLKAYNPVNCTGSSQGFPRV